MHRYTIVLVLAFVLLVQIQPQQAASVLLTSSEEAQERPSSLLLHSWYNRLNEIAEREREEDADRIWKRFSSDLSAFPQKRRFGNTRYGRSLSQD